VIEEGLDAIRAGTLCEVGNIVINALMGTLANVLSLRLEYTVPAYIEGDAARLVSVAGLDGEHVVLLAETEFAVEAMSIKGTIAVFFTMETFARLKEAVQSYAEAGS
jgi:chemotaxis protein CheC